MKRPEILFLVLFMFLFVLGMPEQVAAQQRFSKNCERAESTSDTMACIKKQVEDSQEKLNELYKKIQKEQSAEISAKLGETQKNWITYRDSQCLWEAAIAESGYEKIYELSCVADLTQERTKALTAMESLAQSDKPREFASHPRWMNVLAADYPDVFWRYGQWTQADLDCDGIEEEVMTGVAIENHIDIHGDTVEETDRLVTSVYRAEAVIALSENARTGRSKTTVFRLPIGNDNAGENYFCNVPLGLETEMIEDDIKGHGQQEAENIDISVTAGNCPVRVRVLDGDCIPATVYWDGFDYQLNKNIDAVGIKTEKSDKQTQ